MMYSSTSNIKICLYKLTTSVRIPLDMEFFLLYMVYTAEKFSISISREFLMTQTMLTGTQKLKAVMCMPVQNKTKQNKTINYGDKAVHTQSRIF